MLLSWVEEGLAGEGLSVRQALGQGLAPRFRQQQQADDAQQSAASKDHMMQEVALLVVELHDGRGEHAEACAGQDQSHPSTPAQLEGSTGIGTLVYPQSIKLHNHICLHEPE